MASELLTETCLGSQSAEGFRLSALPSSASATRTGVPFSTIEYPLGFSRWKRVQRHCGCSAPGHSVALQSTHAATPIHATAANGGISVRHCVVAREWCTHPSRAVTQPLSIIVARERANPHRQTPFGFGFCCFVCNGQVFCFRVGADHSRCACIGYSCIHGMPQLHLLQLHQLYCMPQLHLLQLHSL
jgi:hypothetical protein